MVSFGVMK